MTSSMYGDRAGLYDLIYATKDYASESRTLADRLVALGMPEGGRLLEGGCGTGSHLVHLRERFQVEGFDLSPEMIEVARRKVPGVPLHRADLADFSVDHLFDGFICLFSAIGYLLDERRLRACARSVAAALRPGGVVLIEPWLPLEIIDVGRVGLDTWESPDLKIARAARVDLDGEITALHFHWMVARRGEPTEVFEDTHHLWCCPRELLVAAFRDAGFDARFDAAAGDRGLLVGVRTGSSA
jgi:SAM-dependent methyltransferase